MNILFEIVNSWKWHKSCNNVVPGENVNLQLSVSFNMSWFRWRDELGTRRRPRRPKESKMPPLQNISVSNQVFYIFFSKLISSVFCGVRWWAQIGFGGANFRRNFSPIAPRTDRPSFRRRCATSSDIWTQSNAFQPITSRWTRSSLATCVNNWVNCKIRYESEYFSCEM